MGPEFQEEKEMFCAPEEGFCNVCVDPEFQQEKEMLDVPEDGFCDVICNDD